MVTMEALAKHGPAALRQAMTVLAEAHALLEAWTIAEMVQVKLRDLYLHEHLATDVMTFARAAQVYTVRASLAGVQERDLREDRA